MTDELQLDNGKTTVSSPSSSSSFRKRRRRRQLDDDCRTSASFAAGILPLLHGKDSEKRALELCVSYSGSWWWVAFRRRRSHYLVGAVGAPLGRHFSFFLLRHLRHVCLPVFGRPATRVRYRGPRHARQIAPQVLRWLGIRLHADYMVSPTTILTDDRRGSEARSPTFGEKPIQQQTRARERDARGAPPSISNNGRWESAVFGIENQWDSKDGHCGFVSLFPQHNSGLWEER
jgi:hypothetical protein